MSLCRSNRRPQMGSDRQNADCAQMPQTPRCTKLGAGAELYWQRTGLRRSALASQVQRVKMQKSIVS